MFVLTCQRTVDTVPQQVCANRTAPEYQPRTSGLPLMAVYNRGKRLLASSGPDVEKALSHESAVMAADIFIKTHTPALYWYSACQCPYVWCASTLNCPVRFNLGACCTFS
jgi:hypothetical protein